MKIKTTCKFLVVAFLCSILVCACCFSTSIVNTNAENPSSTLILKADKERLWNNETATFTLSGAEGEVSWFVNDQLQEGKTETTFKLENPAKGTYRVYAKVGDACSNSISVTSLVSYGDLMNSLHYIDGKTIEDDMNSYAEGAYVGIGTAEHFAIVKDGENGYLKSIVSQWGGSPWFALGAADMDLVDNYEVSVDVMYPDGTNGICGFQIGGAVDGNSYEIACIHFMTSGNKIVYVNGSNGQIVNSSDPNLGGVYNTFDIKQGEWFRFRMIKLGSEFYYFVDDTLVAQQTISFNYTKLLGIAFIQFLENDSVGLCYDNLFVGGLEVGEAQDIAVTNMQLNLASTEIGSGGLLTASVNWAPYNAKLSDIQWYVNDVLVEGQNGAILNYRCDTAGQIKVQAKCGGISSVAKMVQVIELRAFELKDTSDWEVLREETFEYWTAGTAWGANNPDVLKSDGNGVVEHQKGTPYAKCGMFWDIGTGEFPLNYELSLDFKFKENSNGYVKWIVNGFFSDATDKSAIVTVTKEGTSAYVTLVDESTNTTLIHSGIRSLGGRDVNLSEIIQYNQWYTLTMYKYGDGVAIYIDDTMVGSTEFSRSTAAIANYCIVVTEFPDQPEAGCYIDNAKIRVETIAGKDVETVTVSSSGNSVKVGETVVLTATVFPDTAEYETIAWYVNGQVVESATALEYEFTPATAGEYKIKCVVDGIESLEKSITVAAKTDATGGDGNGSSASWGCSGSLTVGIAEIFAVLAVSVATVFVRKKNK